MSHAPTGARRREIWLLVATFLVAVAGLIYELIAATLSSYLLGDSVRQFSLVIGVFLSAMGVGAYLSRFVGEALRGFIWAQILLGILGGFLAPVVFYAYAWTGAVELPLFGLLIAVGILSGMEIPLIARVLKEIGAPEFRFENVLSVDYVGALAASVAFPLLIVPQLGLMSASLVFGALNLAVAGLSLWLFRSDATRSQWGVWALALLLTGAGLVQSERLVTVAEAALYEDDIILSETTPYQQITVTRFRDRVRLFLDHSIQFDSFDEYRYHEMLVHPAMSHASRRADVLILGGGDGMAAREVLRWADVAQVTLVDLDPRVTGLFQSHDDLAALNDNALRDPRVRVLNQDAWQFVEHANTQFDVVIVDLPDPKNLALSKLYSRAFYSLLMERLSPRGVMVTQAGSPFYARQAFWSVVQTVAAARNPVQVGAGPWTLPYHTYVPSFGDWGFVMAAPFAPKTGDLAVPPGLQYLTPAIWQQSHVFGADTGPIEADVNRLQSHALVGYYLDGWAKWFE
ncbi:polyamine aminopropyltransferase [Epibacterium sp. SM1979]|uniref:Polyamine aminopropyltransferase n=1 Tax=Tritonibacter litoralis TaxID=2662264 RepID=A0A843YFH0_9RHOB|nr:polyamine aminopropyltransferase [Tritonibacter litoralis]MQQ10220.1 polyamine aminopropyltransferase [Tritonibacter litoralis]